MTVNIDLSLSDELKIYRDTLERIVPEKIEPILASYPPDEPLPRDGCVKIRELLTPLGIQACRVPLEHGGSGLGAVGLGIAAETIPYEAFELLMCMEVVALRICLGGNDALKKKYVPRIVRGDKFAGSEIGRAHV